MSDGLHQSWEEFGIKGNFFLGIRQSSDVNGELRNKPHGDRAYNTKSFKVKRNDESKQIGVYKIILQFKKKIK